MRTRSGRTCAILMTEILETLAEAIETLVILIEWLFEWLLDNAVRWMVILVFVAVYVFLLVLACSA